MRVTRHDGSPFHLAGVRPTVPVEPTVAGIRAGRDEVLERALEIAAAGR
jgi:C-terminal processing protease CtpA/Prc